MMMNIESAQSPSISYLGLDLGMGAIKLYSATGATQLPALVGTPEQNHMGKMAGLVQQKPPLQLRIGNRAYLVGAGAHDWGRPLENLDYTRLLGSPEISALFYGALTQHRQRAEGVGQSLVCLVGLPLELLSGEQASKSASAVRQWLKGEHMWSIGETRHTVLVQEVKITSQPAGALFDYLLDAEGKFVPQHKPDMTKEVGVLSIGFNTIELLVVRERTPVPRFTSGATVGVRRLLELVNRDGLYSLGELDAQLRAGALDVGEALPIWQRELTGVVEKRWGQQWKRFARILVVGGGACLLDDYLTERFAGKTFVPNDPIIAIARGLYKQSLLQRKEG